MVDDRRSTPMRLSREQIEAIRKRFSRGLDYDTADINVLCDMALSALSETEYRYPASFVRDAIDNEPELPGDMPDEMWEVLRGFAYRDDREGMIEAMRITVRETKRGIKDRLFKGKP